MSFLFSGTLLAAVFLDTCILCGQTLEVCQLSSAYLTVTYDFDLVENRRMYRECSLNADAAGHLADCEGSADAAV